MRNTGHLEVMKRQYKEKYRDKNSPHASESSRGIKMIISPPPKSQQYFRTRPKSAAPWHK